MGRAARTADQGDRSEDGQPSFLPARRPVARPRRAYRRQAGARSGGSFAVLNLDRCELQAEVKTPAGSRVRIDERIPKDRLIISCPRRPLLMRSGEVRASEPL